MSGPPPAIMATNQPTFDELLRPLEELTEKLKSAETPDERRGLLKQFRSLIEQADQATLDGQ
jgi:hypothetical protein